MNIFVFEIRNRNRMMDKILALSTQNQQKAWDIIKDTNVINIWKSIGATINLIGSLKLGLMMKHYDIDFHIYTSPFSLTDSFAAMAQLAEHPSIKRIEYSNFLKEEDACLEWHAWYEDRDGKMWHIDMIHIVKNSRFDGYFEDVTDRIASVLNEKTKNTILRLKYETPDDQKIMGIEYYQAVIEGGVRTYRDFIQWRKENPVTGIVEWKP